MDTETLNQYLFAELVGQYARSFLSVRQAQMMTEGIDQATAQAEQLTAEDFSAGLQVLEAYRAATLQALAEAPAAPPAPG